MDKIFLPFDDEESNQNNKTLSKSLEIYLITIFFNCLVMNWIEVCKKYFWDSRVHSGSCDVGRKKSATCDTIERGTVYLQGIIQILAG